MNTATALRSDRLDVAPGEDPPAARAVGEQAAVSEADAWHNGVWKPVIAAVNGVCAGGGLHFVADADIVLASSDATFLDPHVSIGQVSAYEVVALVRKSPMEAITRMALAGRHERITAERARQLGILSEVVEPSLLPATAPPSWRVDRPQQPAAMAATKRALWGALESASPRPATGGATSSWPCGANRPPEGPAAVGREESPGGRLRATDRRAAGAGGVVDSRPARPAETP